MSAKTLFHSDYGDVNLFVSGPSQSIASVVELEANARASGWNSAREELLQALPFLLEHLRLPTEHLRLPTSAALFRAIEGDTGERTSDAEFVVGSAKVRYSSKPINDLRSARVSITRE